MSRAQNQGLGIFWGIFANPIDNRRSISKIAEMTEQEFLNFAPSSILEGCKNAIQRGFDDFATLYKHVADVPCPRTVANIIHDHIVHRVKRDVCDDRLRFLSSVQRNLFILDEQVVLVFKKFNEALQSSNYPTPTALSFNLQEDLPGLPSSLPRVEMGYVPDSVGATITGIYAVMRNGAGLHWSIDLSEDHDPRQRDIKFA